MGIKDLNKLLITLKHEYYNNIDFKYIVIDGNNFISSYLCSAANYINGCESIDNIFMKTKLLISNVMNMIIQEINKFTEKFHTKEVWIVFDPKDLKYNIDKDTFAFIDNEYLMNNYSNVNDFVSKNDERNKRISTNKKRIDELFSTFKNLHEDTNEEELKKLFAYNDQSLLFRLLPIVQELLLCTMNEDAIESVHEDTIESKNKFVTRFCQSNNVEADLVIKNVIESLHIISPNDNILLISKDTDYKILFANNENVYITDSLRCSWNVNKTIINPHNLWNNMFTEIPSNMLYDYLIRLSPLFGNDYNSKNGIISLNNESNRYLLPCIFHKQLLIERLHELKYKKKRPTDFIKFVNYIVTNEDNSGGNISLKDFDEYVKQYSNDNLYRSYFETITIYGNWNKYNDYKILHVDGSEDRSNNNSVDEIYKELYYFVSNQWNDDSYSIEDFIKIMNEDDNDESINDDYVNEVFNDVEQKDIIVDDEYFN